MSWTKSTKLKTRLEVRCPHVQDSGGPCLKGAALVDTRGRTMVSTFAVVVDFHFATYLTVMVATRSRSGASAAKTRSGSATSSKATSSAGKTTPSEKVVRPGIKQSVPREEEQPKVGRSWKWEHSAAVS